MSETARANIGINDVLMANGQALNIAGACPHCSGPFSATIHNGPCPRVKSIEYDQYGCVKRVEFHPVTETPHD